MIARLSLGNKNFKAFDRLECLKIDVLIHVVEDEKGLLVLENRKQHSNYRPDIRDLDAAGVYRPIAQVFDDAKDLCTQSVTFFSTVSPVPEPKTTARVHSLFLQKPSSKR